MPLLPTPTPAQLAEQDANVRRDLLDAGFTTAQADAAQAAQSEARRTGHPVRDGWFKGDWAVR